MFRAISLLIIVLVLTACGGTATTPVTGQAVIDGFKGAGLAVENVQTPEREPNSPVPNSYTERLSFTDPTLGDKGGQIFVCDTKQNCDAIYAYFDALKALAGPYLYRSPDGRVVVQLNSGLTPDVASRYETALASLP